MPGSILEFDLCDPLTLSPLSLPVHPAEAGQLSDPTPDGKGLGRFDIAYDLEPHAELSIPGFQDPIASSLASP